MVGVHVLWLLSRHPSVGTVARKWEVVWVDWLKSCSWAIID